MEPLLIILVLFLLLGGGPYGYNRWGNQGLGGILGLVLVIVLVLWLIDALPYYGHFWRR
jgi:hypothetical protein